MYPVFLHIRATANWYILLAEGAQDYQDMLDFIENAMDTARENGEKVQWNIVQSAVL